MNKNYEEDEYIDEAGTGVSFTAFMTAVSFFFIGLLLTSNRNLQGPLRVPLYFLFISTYGFLYSTFVYANATGFTVRENRQRMKKHMYIGDLLSEYFGVYFLVLPIPFILYGFTDDLMLALLLLITGHVFFFCYHYLGYSVLEGFVPAWFMKVSVTVIISINVLNFSVFYQGIYTKHYILAGINGGFILSLFVLSFWWSETLNLEHLAQHREKRKDE